ncbi:unnamed protein product [Diamesa serratosioi]
MQGAMQAGVDCIETIERNYFKNSESTQVKNLVLYHSKNLSSPATEIEKLYLKGLHDRIVDQEEGEENFQLKVVSDSSTKQTINNVAFQDLTLTDYYVIITDDFENFRNDIKSLSKITSFNANGKFLILYNNPTDRARSTELSLQMLELLFVKYNVVNGVIAYGSDAFSYDIYTGDPYHSRTNECGKMKALKIGKCQYGAFTHPALTKSMLKVNKVPNHMERCTFNLCARVQEPFINEDCNDGLEIQIIHFLQQEMGFDINISCSTLERGEPTDDGSWSDLLGKVSRDSCDIIAGAFFPDHEVHRDFAPTEFYLQDYYTFYVQLAPFEARWKGLVTIFKENTWYAFGVVLLVSWGFWYILGYCSNEPAQHSQLVLTFLNVLSVSLGVSANNRPTQFSLRVFFIILSLYALTITTIYTSKLITVFTHPAYDHQVDSLEELVAAGYPIGGRLETMDWFDNDDEMDQIIFGLYNHSEIFKPSKTSINRIMEGEETILISRLYVQSNEHRNDIFGFSQDMFANHLEMIVERGFPLLQRINEIISSLRDMGLMSKLFSDFNYNMTILQSIRELKKSQHEDITEENNDIVLTVEHLDGAFTVYFMGLILSGIVFLLEVLVRSRPFIKTKQYILSRVVTKRNRKFKRNINK